MQRLDHYDRSIIHLLAHVGELNTNEISYKTHMSWATVKEHLKKLKIQGYVVCSKVSKTTRWKLFNQ